MVTENPHVKLSLACRLSRPVQVVRNLRLLFWRRRSYPAALWAKALALDGHPRAGRTPSVESKPLADSDIRRHALGRAYLDNMLEWRAGHKHALGLPRARDEEQKERDDPHTHHPPNVVAAALIFRT